MKKSLSFNFFFVLIVLLISSTVSAGFLSDFFGKDYLYESDADYVEGELMVGFNDDVTEEEAEDIISSHGLSIKEFHDAVSIWTLVNVPEGEEQSWINILENEGIIVYAELNFIVSAYSEVQSSCQNFPAPDFCPGGIDDIIVTGTVDGCSTYGCREIVAECQNFPAPDFCPGGTDDIIITGTVGGCSTYGCRDCIVPTCLGYETGEYYDNGCPIIKCSSQVCVTNDNCSIQKTCLDGTTYYEIECHDNVCEQMLFAGGTPCFNETLDCAKEGEKYSHVFYSKYPTQCCKGLTEWDSGMDTRKVENGKCVETGLVSGWPVGTCINCGNGICEDIEDVCNCPEDCKFNYVEEIEDEEEVKAEEGIKKELENKAMELARVCDGCVVGRKCYNIGYREAGEYCSNTQEPMAQLVEGSTCENSFECDSNLCIDEECISGSFIRKIIYWFKNFFA